MYAVFHKIASIAQLDRATVCGTVGHGFDSLWAHHFYFRASIKIKMLEYFNFYRLLLIFDITDKNYNNYG